MIHESRSSASTAVVAASPLKDGNTAMVEAAEQPTENRDMFQPYHGQTIFPQPTQFLEPLPEETASHPLIDPALMNSAAANSTAHPRSDPDAIQFVPNGQHERNYEQYHSLANSAPGIAQPPAVVRLRQNFDEAAAPITDSANTFTNSTSALPRIDSPTSTPPLYVTKDDVSSHGTDPSYDRPIKRARYQSSEGVSPSYDSSTMGSMPPPNLAPFSSHILDQQNISTSSHSNTPLTPASSHSSDGYKVYSSTLSPRGPHDSPDLRRLSVESLLSGPPGMGSGSVSGSGSNPDLQTWSEQYQDVHQEMTTWGVDRGFKDLDIGKNDDANAISGSSPSAMRNHLDLVLDEDGCLMPVEFGFGMDTNNTTSENGGYYDKPVPISIPRALEPLPTKLLENPMNLLVGSDYIFSIESC